MPCDYYSMDSFFWLVSKRVQAQNIPRCIGKRPLVSQNKLWYGISMLKLVDFYADWCGPCHQMEPILTELKTELEGKIEFEMLDVDDPQHQSKVQDLGVMSIPTYVIEKDGEEVARKIGAMPKETMLHWIESVLQETQ